MKPGKTVFIGLVIFSIVTALSGCGKDADFKKGEWSKEVMFGLDAPNAAYYPTAYSSYESQYSFSEMKAKDAKAYIQQIKDAGFTYGYLSFGDYSYTGTNKVGQTIMFDYDEETKSGTITAEKGKKPSGKKGEGTTVIMENVQWNSGKTGGLTVPAASLTSCTITSDEINYTYENLADTAAYINILKEQGFTVEADEAVTSGKIMYKAKNSNGDSILFTESSITFTKAAK